MADFESNTAHTWEEVKNYLVQKFKATESDKGLKVVFDIDAQRSQLVVVQPLQVKDTLYANVLSRIGAIPTNRLPEALDFMARMIYGSLVYSDGIYFFKITLDMNYTPLGELSNLVMFAAKVTDDLEKEFVGGDKN